MFACPARMYSSGTVELGKLGADCLNIIHSSVCIVCISRTGTLDFAGSSHKLNTLIGCHHATQDLMAI